MLNWANRFGYTVGKAQEFESQVKQLIIILRDPVDRWISGISQYINTYKFLVNVDSHALQDVY